MSQNNKREPSQSDGGGETKRLKSALEALNSIADEYICPITMELPAEPVKAQDSMTYDRSAIEEHIKRQRGNLKSPVTNEPMGPQILPDFQARNMIEKLVKSGAISGDKAQRWEKRIKNEKKVASLKEKAAEGNSKAMYHLGNIFSGGKLGETKDNAKAFEWYEQASDHNYAPGMAAAGDRLVEGVGTAKNVVLGMVLVTSAAERGSAFAAFELGFWFAKGGYGMPKDANRAKEWLQKSISDSREFADDLGEKLKDDARNLLNELVGEGE